MFILSELFSASLHRRVSRTTRTKGRARFKCFWCIGMCEKQIRFMNQISMTDNVLWHVNLFELKIFIAKNIEELQQSTLHHVEGTLAFVLTDQTLLVRNRNGWQYISVRKARLASNKCILNFEHINMNI